MHEFSENRWDGGSDDSMKGMQKVEEQVKKYEAISAHADPLYLRLKESIDIVKDFIRQRGLLVYGGTAIDYALRLRGDNIYPDETLAVPDLDVYSSDSVKDAYDLADILYNKGYTDVRCVTGRYVRVMRVDIGDKHFAADIAYIPPNLFKHIPYVEFEGMRTVHPHYQRVDMHSSLTYPFDGAPMEVVFNRWKKDVERFNKLHAKYPMPDATMIDTAGFHHIIIDRSLLKETFAGLAAYALMYREIVMTVGIDLVKDAGIVPMEFKLTDTSLEFILPWNYIEFIDHSPEAFIKSNPSSTYEKYASVVGLLPKHWITQRGDISVILYSGEHRYTCVAYSQLDKPPRIKFVGMQWLLGYMAGGYIFTPFYLRASASSIDLTTAKNTFLALYNSLLKMIALAENHYVDKIGKMSDDDVNRIPFLLNVYVYGIESMSENQLAQLEDTKTQRHLAETGEESTQKTRLLPTNYYPNRRKPHPVFDYDSSEFFVKDGRRLKN